MTPTFEDVMQLTSTTGVDILLNDIECRAYYDVCMSLPDGSNVLEIGLFFGRSTSIVCQIGKHKDFHYTGVDPFAETADQFPAWLALMDSIGFPYTHLRCTSVEADLQGPFAMALIDGDHTTPAVTTDCLKVMPLIAPGGCICLHDYNRDSLPGVRWGADATLGKSAEWRLESVSGTLAVWRRL